LCQENIEEKSQNEIMQLMDKKQYNDSLRLVEEVEKSQKCSATLEKLVKVRGDRVFEVLKTMEKHVEDYESAVKAARNLHEILRLVSESGEKINMVVEAGFARGLEYYTGMVFEVYIPEMNIALGGGGRYDKLVELFGGESTAAVGVADGIDRIMMAMQKQKARPRTEEEKRVMVIPIKEALRGEALKISRMLRSDGIPVEVEVMGRKVTKALEDADRRMMDYAVIVGERELKEGAVVIRNLKRRKQKTVKIENIVETVKVKT
jgi:histidyl-tRNA synthetase